MAIQQSDIDALQAAIFKGVRVVQYKDRRVEYRSMAEMREALSLAKKQLKIDSGARRRSKSVKHHVSGIA